MNALRTASGHPVSHVAFSPDGATFAAAQPHSGVTLHDRITGQAIRTAGSARAGSYRALVYFDDGRHLAASTPKGLEVFEVANDMAYALYHRHAKDSHLAAVEANLLAAWPQRVEQLTIAPIAADTPGTSRVLRPTESPFEWPLTYRGDVPPPHTLWHIRDAIIEGLSPDGRFVVWLAKHNRLSVGDLHAAEPGRVVGTADAPGLKKPVGIQMVGGIKRPAGPDRVVFAPRGDRFAVRTGKTVSVFDMPADEDGPAEDDAQEVPHPHGVLRSVFQVPAPEKWPAGEAWVPPVAFTPNGRGLLVRRPKQQVQMWDVASGTMQAEWNWRLDGVTCLAVAPDAMTAVAGGRHGKVVVWDLE